MEKLSVPITQAEFAELVGVSQQAVSQMVVTGRLPHEGHALTWLRAYCAHLEEVATSRIGNSTLDLVQERAALAREQRIAHALRNQHSRAEFASTELLSDVLRVASESVNQEFALLIGRLPTLLPDFPEPALGVVMQVVESARAQWLRSTSSLNSLGVPVADLQEVEEVTDVEGSES